jgi:hypothetical protein
MSGEYPDAHLAIVLQMFTHLTPTPFVSEQNPLKDAKIKAAWPRPFAGSSIDSRMQRSEGN